MYSCGLGQGGVNIFLMLYPYTMYFVKHMELYLQEILHLMEVRVSSSVVETASR